MITDEQLLISCLMTDGSLMYEVYNEIREDMFIDEFCKDCYGTMLAIYDKGQTIDFVSVSSELENRKWDRNDISQKLIDSVTVTSASVEIKNCAKAIKQDYKSREVKKLFARIDLIPNKIDNSIAEIMSRLLELQTDQKQNSKTIKQIVADNKTRYFCENESGEKVIKTGFGKIDCILDCLERGDVIVIGARPAVGKSAIALQMINNICKQGFRVGYFNLEMTENQIYERQLSQLSDIELTRIRHAKAFIGGAKGSEKLSFDRANETLESYDLVISDGTKSISQIKAESRHQKFDVIVIDYLQLIKPERQNANRSVEVGSISKSSKEMAKELNVPVVLLSQLRRVVDDSAEPTMDELRESGDIEQDASVVALMWNLGENRRFKGFKIDKNRMGECGSVALDFDGSHMTFTERMDDIKRTTKLANAHSDIADDDEDSPFE